jgi:hypothetical protein
MRWAGAALLAFVVVSFVLFNALSSPHAFASSSKPSSAYYPSTGFGGYKWYGDVTQIGAQWSVPNTLHPLGNHRGELGVSGDPI